MTLVMIFKTYVNVYEFSNISQYDNTNNNIAN